MTDVDRPLVVIPARGGSKGVPRKNLQEVGGLSLVARAVRACLLARSRPRVVVSSDDDEILREAERHGAVGLRRPPQLSGDSATSESAVLHALDREQEAGRPPQVVVLVQCTSPFLLPEDVDRVIEPVADGRLDSCFTAAPFHGIVWGQQGAKLQPQNWPPGPRLPRQERPAQWLENGAAYAMRTASFRKEGTRFCGTTGVAPMPPERSLEIDSRADLRTAQATCHLLQPAAIPFHPKALVLDFDGTLTDNRAFLGDDGREAVAVNRSDGLGIARLRDAGLPMLVISTEASAAIRHRCDKLRIPCVLGAHDKAAVMRDWLAGQGIEPASVVYVGNDVNDLDAMARVGFSACPHDAESEVKAQVHLVLARDGGRGAVRELCDLIRAKLEAP